MFRQSARLKILAIFFLQALAGGNVFARIPDIQSGLGMSDSTLGFALVAGAVAGLAANLIAGRLVLRLGTRPLILYGIPALALVNTCLALAPNVQWLFLILLVAGASFSLTNVAINVEADRIELSSGRRVMNSSHGYRSVGMLCAAGVGVVARSEQISVVTHLSIMAALVSLIMIIVARNYVDSAVPRTDDQPRSAFAVPTIRTLLIVGFGLSAGVAQMASQNWSVIYMRDTFDVSDWLDTIVLPTYLAAMALGRIFADSWIEKFSAKRVAICLIVVGLLGAGLVAGAQLEWVAVLGFFLLGLGSAVQFPLMITAASRSQSRSAAEAVSAVIFLTGIVMMLVPGVIGIIAES